MKHEEKQKHLEGRRFIKTARMSTGRCSIQEDTPQRQTSVGAPARNQAAGEIDFSNPFICVFSPPKHPCLDKDGPCNTQDKTPLPESPLEAPACGHAEGNELAIGGPINVICSPSKGRMEIHMLRKARGDKDVFRQPHQKLSCTGASEIPAFQPVRKRKSTEQHIQAKLNSGDALQRRHKAEAPTQQQKARKASSSEGFPSISPKDKPNDAGPCNTQDKTPLPESPLEAPACGHAEGNELAIGGPINVICSPSKGRMEIHMLRKTRGDKDVFRQPHQKLSCTGASEIPAFQPVRKRKSTEQHIQAKLNSGDALQRRHKAEAPTQQQKARKASSSEGFPSISPKDKPNDAGPCNTQDKTPLPESPLEAPACGHAEGNELAIGGPINVICSPSKGRMEIHMLRKARGDKDVFRQPHQKLSCTGASEIPAFQPVRKRKSTEQHIQAKLNSGDALQRRHKAEAPTQQQKARKASSSEGFPSISPKDKPNDAGPCNTQDKTPLPESPLEAPACGPAEGKKSAVGGPINVICSPSKGRMEIHMLRKARGDKDVFRQPHQKLSCTGASEIPAFQPVRKRKSTEQHIQAKLNSGDALQRRHKAEAPTQQQKARKASSSEGFPSISPKDKPNDAGTCHTQDKTPLLESPLEAPACGPAEGKKSAVGGPINIICSPSKGRMEIHILRKTRGDEDVFHPPHQKVSCTGASEIPAFQPVRKQKSTEQHIQAKLNSGDALQRRHKAEAPTQQQKARKASSSEGFPSISPKDKPNDAGPCNTQDKTPLPESPLEAPACGNAEGKKSAVGGPINIICSPSKGGMEIHMLRKTRRDEDVFHPPHQKVSCTGASEIPAFQPVRKRKSTEQHIQAKLNSGDALQRRHKAEAPTQQQKARKASSSEGFPSISPKDKPNDAGPCNTQDKTPLPESPLEAPASGDAEGNESAIGGPINVICSPSKGLMEIHMLRKTRGDEDAKLNSGDALQRRHKAEAPTQQQKARKASSSESFPSISPKDKPNDAGRRISQGNVPQPESPVEAPACGPAAGEKSSFSQHPIGVSTPSKTTRLNEDETKEKPVSQDSEKMENSFDYSYTYFPSHAPNHNEPFMSPVHGTDVRPMKIYYMHVQLQRGVAVLYHTKKGWEPLSKKIKMEEMTYIGKIHKNVPVSHMSEKKHLIVHVPTLDSGAEENREEADSPAQPPPQGGYPSAKTPEWLVALDSGFRCMACCRVFPSLKILQDHVEYGIREGFSCHVFHNAMSHLKFKARKRRKKEKKEKALFRR